MREFRKLTGRNKRPQIWKIWVDENSPSKYNVEWGILDGAMQRTSDTPGSCGVVGHSDFQTPEEYVIFCMNREIRKKEEHGYVEHINGNPVNEVATSIDFNKPLPKNLCFFKPKKDITEKKLDNLYKNNKGIWTVKRDGMMHIAVKTKGLWEIYTRRMDLATEKFPHIITSLNKLNIPNNSILLGEMVFLKQNRRDDFTTTSRICRSDIDLSLAYQGLGEFPKDVKDGVILGKMRYYIFDVAYFGGKDLISTTNVEDRFRILKDIFINFNYDLQITTGINVPNKIITQELEDRSNMLWNEYIAPLQILHVSPQNDLDLAKANGMEGFVIIDSECTYLDKAYSFDGKAQRPEGIWKRKPKYDEEFIISEIYEGNGRNRGKLGGFDIKQIHPDTGEFIDCGKCGGGFSDEQREMFWENDELIGMVIKVEFDSRQLPRDGIFALRFPVFKDFADKIADECIAQFLGMKDE